MKARGWGPRPSSGSLRAWGLQAARPCPVPPGPTEKAQATGTAEPVSSLAQDKIGKDKREVCRFLLPHPATRHGRKADRSELSQWALPPPHRAPLPHPQEAPLGEGPSQLLPAGASAPLLSDPALPALILQGKQLSNHRRGGGAALCLESYPCIFCYLSEIFLFGVTGKPH